MTKADIVDQISERTGLTKKDVAETVDCFLNAVAKALADGHHIEIRGFGTFRVKDRKSRIARNPRTTPRALDIPARPGSPEPGRVALLVERGSSVGAHTPPSRWNVTGDRAT